MYNAFTNREKEKILSNFKIGSLIQLLTYLLFIWIFLSDDMKETRITSPLFNIIAFGILQVICFIKTLSLTLWTTIKYTIKQEGILVHYITGRKKLVEWGCIQDVCVCYLSGNMFKMIRVNTDKIIDNRRKSQCETLGFRRAEVMYPYARRPTWPRWTDLDYNYRYRKK